VLIAVALTMVGLIGTTPAAEASPKDGASAAAIKAARNAEPSALSGTVAGTLQDGTGNVDGIINVRKFVVRDGELMAVGKFIGTITDGTGKVHVGSKQITMPVLAQQAEGAEKGAQRQAPTALAAAPLSCEVLDLVLGPLDLNLLGLEVHLDTVKLNITAQSGPGNLLGNLLCAVAGLLVGCTGLNGILSQLAGILNQLLAVLG
jgi:hypothetical protein